MRNEKGQYEKGHIPENPICTGERRSKATEFHKGHQPANKLSVGSAVIRQARNDTKRKWIKVAEPNMWILHAIYVWQSARGRIPEGFILHHIDKDTLNDDIDNLCLLTRAAHKNIHKQDLEAGKKQGYRKHEYVDNRIPIKTITCSSCGNTYNAKYQCKNALCDICLRERRRQHARDNQQRIRIANKQRQFANSA